MRKLVLFLFLISCAPPPVTLFERYATVKTANSTGSAISVGHGVFITATHVITSDSFIVFNQRGVDKEPLRFLQFGDITIFKSDLDTNVAMVAIAEPKLGEKVYVLQPVFTDAGVERLLFQGNVAYISKLYAMIDRPIFQGISGSGVYNMNGELIGMASQLYGIQGQVAFGIFLKVSPLKPILEKVK